MDQKWTWTGSGPELDKKSVEIDLLYFLHYFVIFLKIVHIETFKHVYFFIILFLESCVAVEISAGLKFFSDPFWQVFVSIFSTRSLIPSIGPRVDGR